jgi:hypothetical protein
MDPLATTSFTFPAAALLASFLMAAAGVGKRRLAWKTAECRVCGRPKRACTCRWR